jgi:two-component system phosphate regulon sensor histidine kinase PhoR
MIFSKMFRADNARNMKVKGTGLGLYIVKSVVEAAGGGIGFESVEGKGSTFTVSFPLSGMKSKEGSKRLS